MTSKEMLIVSLISVLFVHATTNAESSDGTNSTSLSSDTVECTKICGCDGIYKFDDVKQECVIDYDYLKERTKSSNLMHTEHDAFDDEGMAKRIREGTDRVFKGIIFCAIFFILCASVCVISVCIFCCHIHYSDRKLENEVKALACKLKVNYNDRETIIIKKPRDPKAESCNVIVEDANVMCV